MREGGDTTASIRVPLELGAFFLHWHSDGVDSNLGAPGTFLTLRGGDVKVTLSLAVMA